MHQDWGDIIPVEAQRGDLAIGRFDPAMLAGGGIEIRPTNRSMAQEHKKHTNRGDEIEADHPGQKLELPLDLSKR